MESPIEGQWRPRSAQPGDIMCATTMAPWYEMHLDRMTASYMENFTPNTGSNNTWMSPPTKTAVPAVVQEEERNPWWKRWFGAKITKI